MGKEVGPIYQVPKPISLAIINGHKATMLAMLKHPQSPNLSKKLLEYIIEISIYENQIDILELLLDKAKPFRLNESFIGILIAFCLSNNRADIIQSIESPQRLFDFSKLEFLDGRNAFHETASFADPSFLQYISERGVPIDEATTSGLTPIMIAAGSGNLQAISWFASNGANLESADEQGITPLLHAIDQMQAESVSALLDIGADINKEGPGGLTPLMFAILDQDIPCLNKILEAQAQWDLDSKQVDRCLLIATYLDSAGAIARAIEQGIGQDHLLYKKWSLGWIANYLNAEKIETMLQKTKPLNAQSLSIEKYKILVKQHQDLLARQLKWRPGVPGKIRATCIISPSGVPYLPIVKTEMEDKDKADVTRLIESFKFDLNSLPEHASWIGVEFTMTTAQVKIAFPSDLEFHSIKDLGTDFQ